MFLYVLFVRYKFENFNTAHHKNRCQNYTYNCKDNTRFYTSSVSKMMLGIIAAKMAEDKIINLDTNINNYWQYNLKNDFSNNTSSWKSYIGNEENLKTMVSEDTNGLIKNMTLRHLLTHASSIKDIGELIKGAKKIYLQKFVDREGVIQKGLHEISLEEANSFKDILSNYVNSCELRGY